MKVVYPVSALFFAAHATATASRFNPRSYDPSASKFATCDAVKRTAVALSGSDVQVVDEEHVQIQLNYIDINPGAKSAILMVHGWPADWSTWSYQIEEFKDDYHLIVPSLRGFGKSSHPGDVRSSGTMQDMTRDLDCIMKHAGVEKAVCMGHDWGSQICYEAARARPDTISAVIGVTIPYIPPANRDTFTPISQLIPLFPNLGYQMVFDKQTDKSIVELNHDVRRTLRALYRTAEDPTPTTFLSGKESFKGAYGDEEFSSIVFFTPEEEDYLVEQFEAQGFNYTLQFYTTENRHHSWKFVQQQGNWTLPQPVLTVYSTKDRVADWHHLNRFTGTAQYIPNWTTDTVAGAHWIHLENPEVFNNIVRKWLTELDKEGKMKKERRTDEL
ncbi:hypothetical protein APHAL10511_007939 [Amanita phalloides]|nr:hypothetical protein APHAL10511_007939 [Amanita phalloides]